MLRLAEKFSRPLPPRSVLGESAEPEAVGIGTDAGGRHKPEQTKRKPANLLADGHDGDGRSVIREAAASRHEKPSARVAQGTVLCVSSNTQNCPLCHPVADCGASAELLVAAVLLLALLRPLGELLALALFLLLPGKRLAGFYRHGALL